MTARLTAMFVTVCLCLAIALVVAAGASADQASQGAPPALSRQQRELLQALVSAVDRAAAAPASAEPGWLTHVLRTSDGSHYVAFSVAPPADTLPATPVVLYVRLATAAVPGETTVAERSIVREWLQGSRVDPRLLPSRRGVAIGDMPAMGAGAIGVRGAASVGSGDLQAMSLERERSRQRREEEARRRRAELEGSVVTQPDRLPFEDFEVGPAAAFADGTRAIQRALTAGPGAYDLFVAWVDASQPPARAQPYVARLPLRLGPAGTTDFGLSSIIVADRISVRETPYSPVEQRAHPYAIGTTDILPAGDTSFTPAERLAVAFQIVNPAPSNSGKPDLVVNSRIVRIAGLREEPVASLTPLTYNAATLPPEFDVRLGHPVIAAMAVPLSTVRRGQYKLVVTAEDRLGAAVVSASTPFTVIGTPSGLLAEAPPLARRLEASAMLPASTVSELLDHLAPESPSAALVKALDAARAGRYADLLVEEAVGNGEHGIRAALTGLALLSLGDLGAAAQFRRALAQQAPRAPVQYLLGTVLALQNRDAEAIAAWDAAAAEGLPRRLTAPLAAHMLLRRGDAAGAAAAIDERDLDTANASGMRVLAATRIAQQRESDAVRLLDRLLAASPADLHARWLLLHALYARSVNGDRAAADRLRTEARPYLEARGPHAELLSDWLNVLPR